MKKFVRRMLLGAVVTLGFVAAPLVVVFHSALAAYTATILNDGTNLWYWTTTAVQLQVQNGTNGVSFAIDRIAGPIPPITVVASLPSCSAARQGAIEVVTDASSPTFGGSLTGSSTTVTLAFCNGTAWVAH